MTMQLQAKPERPVFDFVAVSNIASPLVEFDPKTAHFEYFYHPVHQPKVESKEVKLRNVSKLPLTVHLKTALPFHATPSSLRLSSQQSGSIEVTMEHDYRHDLVSHQPKCATSSRLTSKSLISNVTNRH
jgi:hypothetical protein